MRSILVRKLIQFSLNTHTILFLSCRLGDGRKNEINLCSAGAKTGVGDCKVECPSGEERISAGQRGNEAA